MDATTVAYVKSLLDITNTDHDTVLGRMITSVSQRVEDFIGRPLESTARTEYYSLNPRQDVVFLRAYPLTAQASITAVTLAMDWDFTAATAMTSTDYNVNLDNGMLHFNHFPITNYRGNNSATAPDVLRVDYTGGFATTAANIQANYPAISAACETQVIAMWRRRGDPQGSTVRTGDYSATKEAPLAFVPDVREALMPYRRMRFGL